MSYDRSVIDTPKVFQQYLFARYYIGSWSQILCLTIESPPCKAYKAPPLRRSACIYIVAVALTFYRQLLQLQPHNSFSLRSNTSSTIKIAYEIAPARLAI
jgi:hypothetical protein